MSSPPARHWKTRPAHGVARRGVALALLLVVAAGAAWTASTEEGVPASDAAFQPSRIARLAERSLLLGAARAGGRMVVVGEHGHVLRSDDRGESWRQVVVPTRSTLTAVTFPTPSVGFAVGHDAIILRTQDAGETWTRQYADPGLESPLLDVWFADAEHGLAVGAYGLALETRDGGDTWMERALTDRDVHHNAIASNDGGQLFVAGERGSVLRSDDMGETWVPLSIPEPASLFGALGVGERGVMVFGLRGRILRSDDGGDTWRTIETGTRASIMGGTITEDGAVVLGGITGVVLIGEIDDDALTPRERADRKAVSTAAPLPGGDALLVGAFGVEPPSEWRSHSVRVSERPEAR